MTWADFLGERDVSFDERCARWELFCSRQPNGGDPGCLLRHVFCEGVYMREITMPAGSLILSRIHKFEHPFFVLRGCVRVITKDADKVYRGGDFGITFPGTQRILLNAEDTVWVTVHQNPDGITDPEQLFDVLTEPCRIPYPRS